MNHPIDSDPEISPRVDPELCASTSSFESLRMVSEVEPLRDSERSRTVSTLSSTPRSLRLEESLSKGRREDSKHLKLLETLIDNIIKRLEDNSCQPKIRDALKAIKLKQELSEAKSVGVVKTSEAERSETHRAERSETHRAERSETHRAERSETHRAERSETHRAERSETHRAEKMFWEEIETIRRCELRKLYPEPTSLEAQIQAAILSLKDLVKNGILPVKTVTDVFNQGRSKQGRLTYHRMARLLTAMGFTKAKTPNGCSAIIWDDKLLYMSP